MKIVATIEARMNSSRLPKKVLMDLGNGMSSLEYQIKRLQRSQYIDEIIVATTTKNSDNVLESFAREVGVSLFRGSEFDVMMRILGAAKSINGDLQVQLTGDCPLIDPKIVDLVIENFIKSSGKFDFVSNEIIRSYPIGLDCRVFPVKVLQKAESLCKDPIHRSHGSTYIYASEGSVNFKCKNILAPDFLNHPNLRWTLDEPSDLEFIKHVVRNFENYNDFSSEDIMSWLNKNPEIISINSNVRQKAIEEG